VSQGGGGTGGQLSFTGFPAVGAATVAALAILLGVLLITVGRRRGESH
jgi:hypothetical protein